MVAEGSGDGGRWVVAKIENFMKVKDKMGRLYIIIFLKILKFKYKIL